LRDEGSSNIRLVRGSQRKRERRTDLLADRGGETYAFDVACSSAGAERRVQDLRAFLGNRYVEKLSQLEGTRQEHACPAAGLILVLNSDPALTFGYQPKFREVLQQVHRDLGGPPALHLALVTGRTTTVDGAGEHFSGPDDVVWPAWPARA